MKKIIFCFSIIFVALLSNFIFGAIPASERAALIALYNSTNGDSWTNNSGWKTPPLDTDGFAMPGAEGNWYGVYSPDDQVIDILLAYNNLTGNLSPELSNLRNLVNLDLRGNQLCSRIPSDLGNLSKLQTLRLAINKLSGEIPPGLGNLSNLQELWLDQNQLSGSIPSELANLNNLQILSLFCNQLSGSIPSELGNLTNLRMLELSENQLSGSLPPELGNANNLKILVMSYNQLSGSIPLELGNLSNLQVLSLDNNQLNGNIPPELGNPSNLVNLVLNCNQLSGSIPLKLGNPTQIEYLNLSCNRLSGDIPSTFLNLKRILLGDIDISYNCLSTTDPALIAWLNSHKKDWANTQDQCGPATIPKITTSPVSAITLTGAICGGYDITDGGAPLIGKGVCWSTSRNPNVADSKTNDGYHLIGFYGAITGLKPDTKYYVRAYATNIIGTAYGANISFITTNSPGTPEICLNHMALNFGASINGTVTDSQAVVVSNTGNGTLNWSALGLGSPQWISFTPSSDTADSVLSVSVNPAGLAVGNYSGLILVTDFNASNSPQAITVTLNVYDEGQTSTPFGEFTTPLAGSSIYNSIPVTGWVLDDIGVENVKIYNDDSYIGDAVIVEGARPDVETAYPGYPNNHKAGWGYMLLTHFLPNGGNGTYTLIAKATDMEGNEVTLGSKTITIDNVHAVKPFGAIDTPTQGGTASGKNFVNYGWALTPQSNIIPVDGSTINVVIDGLVKGHPVYNVFRSDIATLFPAYANTNGAIGYYYLDTTKLTNGVHTIAWDVTDNAGNRDGIGSRYFSVMNTETSSDSPVLSDARLSQYKEPSEGFLSLEPADELNFEIKELERVEINLSGSGGAPQATRFEGYLVVGDQLRKLPIGSTLDRNRGVFYWQPGPGFVGEYRFVFIGKNGQGQYTRKAIVINIKPRH